MSPVLQDGRFDDEVRIQAALFSASDGDFAVLVVETQDGDEFVAAGSLGHLEPGMRARVAGEWREHPRHGLQVQAELGYELDPNDEGGARKYLLTIKGIGPGRAKQLIERHGPEVFDAIDRDPQTAFAALPGVGATTATKAADSWRQRRVVRELYLLLAPHGAGWLAGPLRVRLGPEAATIVRTEPYRLTEEDGVGFQTADAIARAGGLTENSPARRRAAAVHVLREAENRGDTFLPLHELTERAARLVGTLPPEALDDMEAMRVISLEDGKASRIPTLEAERATAEHLSRLATAEPTIKNANPPKNTKLSPEQLGAVQAAFERRLSVVTGGPGTGKTTLVKAITQQAEAADIHAALCAPTGRAARRLEEATGHDATTIHRLLEWVPGEGPIRDAHNPIDADLLVVDESSMLSLSVARPLLEAVGPETHVVFIGDADQLPPVGAGKPFADLIESEAAPVTRLEHVFRQAARSLIVQAAHSMNHGELPRTQATEEEVRDFFFIETKSDQEAADQIVDLASGRLAKHYAVDPVREVQVLSPIYRGRVGVNALNERLRAVLNPDGEECLDKAVRAGDKLIQTKNDYDTGLMNGQLVVAVGPDDDGDLIVESDDARRLTLTSETAAWLRPAYAISVHKSQGCEMPVVVVPVHSSHSMLLSRNLLYTAVTRARQACVMVGQPGALATAVRRADAFRRNTRLTELIRAA